MLAPPFIDGSSDFQKSCPTTPHSSILSRSFRSAPLPNKPRPWRSRKSFHRSLRVWGRIKRRFRKWLPSMDSFFQKEMNPSNSWVTMATDLMKACILRTMYLDPQWREKELLHLLEMPRERRFYWTTSWLTAWWTILKRMKLWKLSCDLLDLDLHASHHALKFDFVPFPVAPLSVWGERPPVSTVRFLGRQETMRVSEVNLGWSSKGS